MGIIFKLIEERDNKEIAELIRTVFREFNIHRPGTVYFDPTTDNLFGLFRTPGSEYWIAEENGVILGGCGVYPTPGCQQVVLNLLNSIFQPLREEKVPVGNLWRNHSILRRKADIASYILNLCLN